MEKSSISLSWGCGLIWSSISSISVGVVFASWLPAGEGVGAGGVEEAESADEEVFLINDHNGGSHTYQGPAQWR